MHLPEKKQPVINPSPPQSTLLRHLGLLDSTFLVIGAVLGSGIFMTTGLIAENLPSPMMIMAVFLVGGFITLSGALAFGELGAMFPRAGGQYVYLLEAYGPSAGFFFGWVFFWVIQCGGAAALAVGLADSIGPFISASFSQPFLNLDLGFMRWILTPGQLLAVGAILMLSASNYFGIKGGITIQNIFTIVRLLCVALFFIGGLVALARRPEGLAWSRLTQGGLGFSPTGFGLSLVTVLWAYDGWYAINCTAEEVKNPKRDIPLSLILGTVTVTVIYMLLNLEYFLAMPLKDMVGVGRIGEAAAVRLFGLGGGSLMAVLIAVTIFGCLSATLIYGPRVFFAMARDGLFFSGFKDIHPRFRVPAKAIAGQAVWASLLCLSGQFQALIEFVVFALVLFFAASGLAVIVLRRRQPGRERPYKTWGYPVLPLLFVAMNLAIFLNRVIAQTKESLGGIIILLLGIPAYWYWKTQSRRTGAFPAPAVRDKSLK
jgi:APA family basic amino acid/polyamine antiporter